MMDIRSGSFAIVLTGMLMFPASDPQAAPTVSFEPRLNQIDAGASFSVDLVISDFPTTEGGGVSLRFNPAVLEVNAINVSNGTWSFASDDGDYDKHKGRVSDILFSRFPGVVGDSVIATINFRAIRKGHSRLRLKGSTLNPFASGGQPVAVDFQKGKVLVRARKNRVRGDGDWRWRKLETGGKPRPAMNHHRK